MFFLYLLLLVVVLVKPIEAFAPQLAEYRIAMILSLGVFGLALVGALRTGEMAIRMRHLFLLLGLTGVVFASVAVHGWLGGANEALISFLPSVLMFLTTAMVVTTLQRLKVTCAMIALCMVVLSIASIAAYHKGFMVDALVVREGVSDAQTVDHLAAQPQDMVPAEDTSGANLWRVRSWGFFSDPNDFSQAILMSLPMLLGAWLQRRSMRNLVRIWVPAALLLYAVYLTHSRGATLGFAMMLLYGLLGKAGPVKTFLVIGLFGMLGMAVGVTGGRSFSANEESAGGRIDAWSEGLTMMRSEPLFGVGYGQFTEHHAYTAHNSFVLSFAELGLLGYFFWLALLVLAFRELGRAVALLPDGSEERRWAKLLRLSLLGFLTCALFLSRSYVPTLFLLLALCYAAVYCAERAAGAEELAAAPPVRWFGTTLLAIPISIAAIYVVVRLQNALGS
jgi:O-antigen ligase